MAIIACKAFYEKDKADWIISVSFETMTGRPVTRYIGFPSSVKQDQLTRLIKQLAEDIEKEK